MSCVTRATVRLDFPFEMAHRLYGGDRAEEMPVLCRAIHGHSWKLRVHIEGPLNDDGMVVEFGYAKRAIRRIIDVKFDHALALNAQDPLAVVLEPYSEMRLLKLKGEPTTERLAAHLLELITEAFSKQDLLTVTELELIETPVNSVSLKA